MCIVRKCCCCPQKFNVRAKTFSDAVCLEAVKGHTLEVAVAPLCQLPLLMAELPDMPDRVSALRLRPASCLLCGMQTVTC